MPAVEVASRKLERRRSEGGREERRAANEQQTAPIDAAEHVAVPVRLDGVAHEARRFRDVSCRVEDRRDGQQLEQVHGGKSAPTGGGERQRHDCEHDPAARRQADEAERHGTRAGGDDLGDQHGDRDPQGGIDTSQDEVPCDVELEAWGEPERTGQRAVRARRSDDEPAPAEAVGERAQEECEQDPGPYHCKARRQAAVVDGIYVRGVGQRQGQEAQRSPAVAPQQRDQTESSQRLARASSDRLGRRPPRRVAGQRLPSIGRPLDLSRPPSDPGCPEESEVRHGQAVADAMTAVPCEKEGVRRHRQVARRQPHAIRQKLDGNRVRRRSAGHAGRILALRCPRRGGPDASASGRDGGSPALRHGARTPRRKWRRRDSNSRLRSLCEGFYRFSRRFDLVSRPRAGG